ncbi:MAG TPA: transglutaminase-like domain-containing protein [Mobilitalea sp.]|nr:transglutaminase-like domain-containing protein [Mobilitalea sp.]
MKRERKDGLYMDNSIFMIDEKKPGFPIQTRIIQMIAILIGSWGSIGVLMESIPVPADYLKVNIAIFLCAALIYTLCLIPAMDLVKLFFGLLFYGLFIYSRFPHLQNAFYLLENAVLDRLEAYYEFQTSRYMADYTAAAPDSTLLLIMIVIPIVTLMTIAVMRSRLAGIAGILLFLPVTISFSFGLIPSERYLIAYLAAVLYMSRSSFTNQKVAGREQKQMLHRINSKAAVWLSIICLTIFFLLKLFITEQKYDTISQIKETKSEIQTTMLNFSLEDINNKFKNVHIFSDYSIGGLKGGELGNVDKVEFTESEQLRIKAAAGTISNGLYLKGYVGSTYTGYSWVGQTKEEKTEYKLLMNEIPREDFNPVNQLSQMMKLGGSIEYNGTYFILPINQLTVEYADANKKYMYAPYFTNFDGMENVKYLQDLYAAPVKKKDQYTFNYYNTASTDLSIDSQAGNATKVLLYTFSKDEEQYRQFVHEVYTQLPKDGLDRLKADFSSIGGTINDKVQYVSDYLSKNTTYSLSPGKLTEGKDFVEYFLYENKKGYCAHYASAAALMLRAMGVPARYVEGYVVSPTDIQLNAKQAQATDSSGDLSREVEVSVKDYNAHAWVEIYYDGIGWVPTDFTPSSGIGYGALAQSKVKEGTNRNTAITPTEAPVTQPPKDITKPPVNKPDTQDPKTPNSNSAKTDTSNAASQKQQLDQLFLILFILLMTGAIAAVVFILISRQRKKLHTTNRNKKAILLFARMEKLLAVCHGLGKKGARLEDSEEYVKENCSYLDPEAFVNCMEIVRKARFGKGRITRSELGQVEIEHLKLLEKVSAELSFVKKLYLEFLLVIASL